MGALWAAWECGPGLGFRAAEGELATARVGVRRRELQVCSKTKIGFGANPGLIAFWHRTVGGYSQACSAGIRVDPGGPLRYLQVQI